MVSFNLKDRSYIELGRYKGKIHSVFTQQYHMRILIPLAKLLNLYSG